jgi:hypothetical protein
LERLLLSYAKGENLKENLSMLFRPLFNSKIEREYEKDKAKVGGRKTWLRLYAIPKNKWFLKNTFKKSAFLYVSASLNVQKKNKTKFG